MTVHLCFEFESVEKMAEWFEDLRFNGVVEASAAVYMSDALDQIGPGHTFIVKRLGDRPDKFRLIVENITIERRKV